MARVALHLVTWNGERYLPFLFESLRKQTYRDVIVRVLDNASNDATVQLIKKELTGGSPWPVEFFENQTNAGFGGGHNQLFEKVSEEFVLLVNQDMYLMSDCIEKLLAGLQSDSSLAVAAPRLMKWDFNQIEKMGLSNSFSDRIDSLGLKLFRSRRVVEWRAGEKWTDSAIKRIEVFGVSGALPLYRMSALRTIADNEGNIFDPLFESYKEDVDVAWRLLRSGYRAQVVADAVAYHDRTAAMPKLGLTDMAAALNKFSQPRYVRYVSYRNHLLMLFKNESRQDFLLNFPWIIWYEVKKMVALLITHPSLVFKSWSFVWQHRGEVRDHRKF